MNPSFRKKGNHLKKNISLICLLANENTSGCRLFLKEIGCQEEPRNHAELEYFLAKAYKETDDKIEFEKKLSQLHPHREFILKFQPKEIKQEPIISEQKIIEKLREEIQSNACGCGGTSQFDGETKKTIFNNNSLINLAIISILAITIVKISKSN